ncbi:hypothetical protein ACFXPI_31000 [Streptomyces sp. NPDC059104]|uniref:hypothetical protein n=1 Tax=Streptomyces sp. NPDC059104 TaxID=3346729 RepID=UPI0036BDED94
MALLGGVAGVVLTAVLMAVLWWPRTEVTYRDSAPSAVVYPDGVRVRFPTGHEVFVPARFFLYGR